MTGATIGQYRVTGLIGRGGMGAVYAAEHSLLGRSAAIKVLLPELSQKQEIVMRFFNEARAATAIRHPGIVEIYDFGWTPEGAAFIVMEHLEGETLSRRSARARLRWPAALAVARQIAGALAAAHGKGIVHRDLKPDNVFLVPDPEVPGGERIKLLDFGIAKLAGDTSSTVNVTKTGAVMGTPTYMAPEQCRGVAVDHRVDLYALGCVVFELCTGRPPFVGEGTGDVLAAHIHVPVPSLASVGVEVPHAVEELIRQLLVKSPSQRMPNAEALIRAIDAITTTIERTRVTVGTSSGVQPLITTSPSVTTLSGAAVTSRRMPKAAAHRRGRWFAIIAAATVTVVVAVVIVAVTTGDHRGDRPRVVSYESVSHSAAGAPAKPAPFEPAPPTRVEPTTAPATPAASKTPEETAPPQPSHVGPATTMTHEEPAKPPSRVEPASQPSTTPPATPPPHPEGPAPQPSRVETARQPPSALPTTPPRLRVEPPKPPPTPTPATVDVTIDSVPAGAQVLLAGKVLGKTPFHDALPRRDGDTTLVIRLAGYADKSVAVHAGQPVSQHLKLVRSAPTPMPKANRDQSVNPFGN